MKENGWTGLKNLVVVAGHAVYVVDDFDNPAGDESWSLQEFQKGEPRFYIEHIRRGVEMAAQDAGALLVFSGGQTRREAGRRSEAQSYRLIAEHFDWWKTDVSPRTACEEYARDSFENLLFGICRFHECTANYPQHVAVVSWAFKRERFQLHREAIRFPSTRFHFEGAGNPVDLASAVEAERRNAVEPFKCDPYGTGGRLAEKRDDRNPFGRRHPYESSCTVLSGLLRHRGTELYAGALPWG